MDVKKISRGAANKLTEVGNPECYISGFPEYGGMSEGNTFAWHYRTNMISYLGAYITRHIWKGERDVLFPGKVSC